MAVEPGNTLIVPLLELTLWWNVTTLSLVAAMFPPELFAI